MSIRPIAKLFNRKSQRGFTLIELIVVFVIISILGGIGINAFFDYAHAQTLQAAANSVLTILNDARSRSLSQVKNPVCPSTAALDGYKVVINDPKTYDLYVVCGGTSSKIGETKSLPDKITFSGATSTSFLFSVLTGRVVGPGTIVLSGYGKTRVITVEPIGLIIAAKVMPAITLTPFPTAIPPTPIPTNTPTPTLFPPTPTPTPSPMTNFVLTWGFGVKNGTNVFQICYDSDPPCTSGILGVSNGQFNTPSGIAVDSNNYIYVADTYNHRIQKFSYPSPTPTPTPTPSPTPSPTPLPFKRVFVTSATYTGALGGLTGGDAKCQSLADAPGSVVPGRTWKAWLSNQLPPVDAKDGITYTGEYRLVDNTTVVANNKTDLIDGTLLPGTFINRDETNSLIGPPSEVWTGTGSNGICAPACGPERTCDNWTMTSGTGEFGNTTSPSGCWTDCGQINCASLNRLYCFEQ